MPIEHIFAVMLENRSFDHLLGWSAITGTDVQANQNTAISGAAATNQNKDAGGTPYSQASPAPYIMDVDPGHEFPDVLEQLTTVVTKNPLPGGTYPQINMGGFVTNFQTTLLAKNDTDPPTAIMQGFATSQLPILTALAREFCVFDNWFSALPGPTWPNRFFFHAATAGGWDHSPDWAHMAQWTTLSGFHFQNGTIFDVLTKGGVNWAIYSDDELPQVRSLAGIANSDIRPFSSFAADIARGDYPAGYTFIEPNYGHDIFPGNYKGGNSEHPTDDVTSGDGFLKTIYEALRASPLWERSLLLVAYDEHGGFYDHVSPPPGEPPNDTPSDPGANAWNFKFDLLGVRVPAILVSPLLPKNLIDHRPYDHATWPATIESVFNLAPMTARDKWYVSTGRTLDKLPILAQARTDAPQTLPPPANSQIPIFSDTARLLAKVGSTELPEGSDPPKGTSLGFLHVAMMMHAESIKPSERQTLVNTVRSIKTQRQASQFIEGVRTRLRTQRMMRQRQ
jgi:phospholipase C